MSVCFLCYKQEVLNAMKICGLRAPPERAWATLRFDPRVESLWLRDGARCKNNHLASAPTVLKTAGVEAADLLAGVIPPPLAHCPKCGSEKDVKNPSQIRLL